MKVLKKGIAFVLAAGLMLSAMTVFASSGECVPAYNTSTNIGLLDGGGHSYTGNEQPNSGNSEIAPSNGDVWLNTADGLYYTFMGEGCSGSWIMDYSCSSAPEVGSAPLTQQEIADIQGRAETEAVQGAAYDEGFVDVGDMYRAAEKGMSAGEYYNNVVTSTPGIENAITVGQGGNLIVDGKETNMSATISKVTNRAYVDSVRVEQEGTVLNVVDVQYPAVEATINFYTPGVIGEMEIVALQYNAGTWVEVEVAEVREDHVVLNMKGNGVVAFIAK